MADVAISARWASASARAGSAATSAPSQNRSINAAVAQTSPTQAFAGFTSGCAAYHFNAC